MGRSSFPAFIGNSHLFVFLGFGLIFLAIICFPAKVWVVTQPQTPEMDLLWMGPIYAILIGLWSFPNLLLGVLESSVSRKAGLWRSIPILCLTNVIMADLIWNPIMYGGVGLQELLNFSPFLVPCISVNVTWLLYAVKSERLVNALKDLKVRVILIIVFAAFPIFTAGWILYSWFQTIF